jgi:hypothetical protein
MATSCGGPQAAGFEVLLSADLGLSHQQNFTGMTIRVIVLAAGSNKFDDLISLLPAVQAAVQDAQPGETRIVRAP